MRIGMIARCCYSGLGIQSKEFFDNVPCKAMVLDLSNYAVGKQNFDWYPGQTIVKVNRIGVGGIPVDIILDFIKDIDVLITFEIPYDYNIFQICRDNGVKTILQLNYEFLEYPSGYPYPDLFAAPSMWHYDDIPDNKIFLPVPVNTKHFHPVKKQNTFVHIVGKPAVYNRNGTDTFIKCLRYIKSNIKVIVQSQYGFDYSQAMDSIPDNVILVIDNENKVNYYDNYNGGVLVMPRKYGGLCLPINEALAAGMPVIATDISPNNTWLPKEWLVPANKSEILRCKKTVDVYEADVIALATKIDQFCEIGYYDTAVEKAIELGNSISWQILLPAYKQMFNQWS